VDASAKTKISTGVPNASASLLDRPSTIAAASYLSALTLLAMNIQPLILGAVAKDHRLNDSVLGQLAGALVGSVSLMSLTAPFWIRKLNWRTVSAVATCLCAAIWMFGSAAQSTAQFLAVFVLVGLLQACIGAPSFAALGDSSNPERAYGVSIVFQSIVAALVAIPLSNYIIPHHGAQGAFVFVGVLVATGVLVCRWLPATGREVALAEPDLDAAKDAGAASDLVAPACALLALFALTFGVFGYWFFIERIGTARGHSTADIGVILSAGSLSSILAAGTAAWLGGKVRNRVLVSIGTAGLIAAYGAIHFHGLASYAVSNILFSMSYGLVQPPYWAILRKVDVTNRMFVVATAVQGAAGVVVGLVAGLIIGGGGYGALLVLSAVTVAAGAAILGLSGVIASKRRPLAGPH